MSGISVLQSLSPPNHSPTFIQNSSKSSTTTDPSRRSAASSASPIPSSSSSSSSAGVDEQIRKIKDSAKDVVNREARNASSISVLNTAKRQLEHALTLQSSGDYPDALRVLYITAGMVRQCLDSQDYKAGVIKKEMTDFLTKEGKDLFQKTGEVESQLRSMLLSGTKSPPSNGIIKQSGGSITDRLRSLEGAAGTTLKTTKPLSKDPPPKPSPLPKLNGTPKHTPRPIEDSIATPSPRPALPSLGLSSSLQLLPSHPSHTVPPTPASAVTPSSPHAFVPTSALGPPSPTSSPASSPRMTVQPLAPPPPPPPKTGLDVDMSKFESQFPSIEELEADLPAIATGELTSMPTGASTSESKFNATYPPLSAIPTGSSTHSITKPVPNGSSSPSFRPFVIPMDRPSSTPIVPVSNGFNSRPPSPPKPSAAPAGIPTVPEEEANLIPPEQVAALMDKTQALLLDVRSRNDYLKEQIDAKANAMICIEPAVLQQPDVSCSKIEDALALSSANEANLFKFRNRVEYVIILDQASTSFGPSHSPLSILVKALNTCGPATKTKHPPLLMVGGLDAWKKQGRDIKGTTLFSPTLVSRQHSSSIIAQNSSSFSPPSTWKQANGLDPKHKVQPSIDYPVHHRMPAESNGSPPLVNDITPQAARRPAISRSAASSISTSSSSRPDMTPRTGPITYPQVSTRMSSASTSIPPSPITSPPAASSLSRRRSDYVDQSQEALARHTPGHSVDYPTLPSMSMSVLRPPPPVATPVLERQDHRPRIPPKPTAAPSATLPLVAPSPPRINSQVAVVYWSDQEIQTSGLRNMGNTCYMNSTIQCLLATVPFTRFFLDPAWMTAINHMNKMGSQGKLAGAFAALVRELVRPDNSYIVPKDFRRSICETNQQYLGSDQHDSQEFLSFLLDGIHEDLNRILAQPDLSKTAEQEAELERMPPALAAEQEWQMWRMRNDSIIVDYFQGQFRNRLECQTCGQTSTTYNAFSLLSLPIPMSKSRKVPLEQCFEAYCNRETLDKDDAWLCTRCKTKRTTAKELKLSRLPPVLIIHLKRFENHGRFSDKMDTFVEYPLKGLDLDRFMPSAEMVKDPLSSSDPRRQGPPYRYDLYAVTNHYGNLSSGHYTAFVASGMNWLYCDDSSVKPADPKEVVNQKAYVLFYKRVKA